MIKSFRTILALCFVVSTVADGFCGQDLLFGFKVGYLGSGTVHVEGIPFATDSSHNYGAFLDYKVAPKLYMGMNLSVHNISAFGIEKNLMEFGGAFKAVIPTSNDKIMVRPVLNLGYGMLPEIQLGNVTVFSSSYFLVSPSLELDYETDNDLSVFGEIGFLSAPIGGNAQATVTLSPTLFIRSGIAF